MRLTKIRKIDEHLNLINIFHSVGESWLLFVSRYVTFMCYRLN